jgi:hypothetical protein
LPLDGSSAARSVCAIVDVSDRDTTVTVNDMGHAPRAAAT